MVAIIDYKMGNTGSVKNALHALGYEATITSEKADIEQATHLILPGVGAFPDGMKNLHSLNLVDVLTKEVLTNRKPILGICLGMQMMATKGEEGGVHEGLGWIAGTTRKFQVDENKFKVPHVGWNDVEVARESKLLREISKPIFYFVHSYHFVPENADTIKGLTDYGEKFVSVIEQDNIFGAQFHPEKSQQEGLCVIRNFLQL